MKRSSTNQAVLDFDGFRALMREVAQQLHEGLSVTSAVQKLLKQNVLRWAMHPKLGDSDALTCDHMVQTALAEHAGLVRVLFRHYAASGSRRGGGGGSSDEGSSDDGREIMAGHAGEERPRLSTEDFVRFAVDFELCPAMLSERQVSRAAREAVAIGAVAQMPLDDRELDGMYLPDFIDALALLAHRMYDDEPLDVLFSDRLSRVQELLARIVRFFEPVFKHDVLEVLSSDVPAPALFSDVVSRVPCFQNDHRQVSAIYAYYQDSPGKMGVSGLYKLIRDCGLLDNAIDMARALDIYANCSGTTPAMTLAARASGQLLGMNEPQFWAALVYLAAYRHKGSVDRLPRQLDNLMQHSVLPKAAVPGPSDPALNVLLQPAVVETLSRYSSGLRQLYDHFAAVESGATAAAGRSGAADDPSSLSLTEFNDFARQCNLFPEVLSSEECAIVFHDSASLSPELSFPQFIEAMGRTALMQEEVIATPAEDRVESLFRVMGLDSEDGGVSSLYAVAAEKSREEHVPVGMDRDFLANQLAQVTTETFSESDESKSAALRTESEKWAMLQQRNTEVRPPQGTAAFMGGGKPKASGSKQKGKAKAKAAAGASKKNVKGPKMVAPSKKGQKLDWSERGDPAKVMLSGSGKTSLQRPQSAPARQAPSAGSGATQRSPSAMHGKDWYAAASAGGSAAAARHPPGRSNLGAANEQLCLIHELLFSPECPYPEVADEVERAFAAHQLGDCETALDAYRLSYTLWLDASVEATGCDAPTAVKVFLLNSIGMVHQSAGRFEDTLAAFLDAKLEANHLDPEHPDVALSLSNIGAAYYQLGSIGMALDFYDQALAIREQTLGRRHVDTGLLYNNKACCLRFAGDVTQARALLYTAHEIFEDGLGPTHPRTFAALRNVSRARKMLLNARRDLGRLPARDLSTLGRKNAASASKKGKGKKGKKGKGKKGGKKGKKGKKKKKKKK